MTDIFKLIYEHDLRLDRLRERDLDRSAEGVSSSLEDFLKPDPTYSKFYFSGTVLNENCFGLNCLKRFDDLLSGFEKSLARYNLFLNGDIVPVGRAIAEAGIGTAMILSEQDTHNWPVGELGLDHESNVGHKKEALATVLKSDDLVLYKEQAHNGFDLHLFSKRNIYNPFFENFKKLVSNRFRFFSINGKRIRSERKFYFETWTLDRPPHGVEEVFEETELR